MALNNSILRAGNIYAAKTSIKTTDSKSTATCTSTSLARSCGCFEQGNEPERLQQTMTTVLHLYSGVADLQPQFMLNLRHLTSSSIQSIPKRTCRVLTSLFILFVGAHMPLVVAAERLRNSCAVFALPRKTVFLGLLFWLPRDTGCVPESRYGAFQLKQTLDH